MSKQKIYRAGIIPYYVDNSDIKMLFMIPSSKQYGGDSPQCIKGVREEGETALAAALREGKEEAGLFRPNIKGEPHHLGTFLGRTDIFVAEIKDKELFGDPTTPHEVESTRWMTPDEFQKTGRNLHKPLVGSAVRYIKTKHNKQLEEMSLLVEMPHIYLKTGAIDLQLEINKELNSEEFIQYIKDLLDGKSIQSKDPSKREMKVPPESKSSFARELLKLDMFQFYILKHYDRKTWYTLNNLLTSAAIE